MQITLYKTNDDYITLDKTLTDGYTLQGQLTTSSTMLNPQFIIRYNNDILNYNYLFAFNRYYYIDNINLISGENVVISCSIDVLKTYSTAIKNCACTVVRSESVGKPTEIIDSKLPINPNKKVIREMHSNNPFTIGLNNYVLTTLKGGGN